MSNPDETPINPVELYPEHYEDIDLDELLPDGKQRWQLLKNGALYDHSVKQIKKAPPVTAINKDNAREYQLRRWELAEERARAAIASKSETSPDVYGGWETIVKAQAGLALDVDKGRASTEASKFVGQAAAILRPRANSSGSNGHAPVVVNVDKFLALLVGGKDGDTPTGGGSS